VVILTYKLSLGGDKMSRISREIDLPKNVSEALKGLETANSVKGKDKNGFGVKQKASHSREILNKYLKGNPDISHSLKSHMLKAINA
jgi:hypothetical protein